MGVIRTGILAATIAATAVAAPYKTKKAPRPTKAIKTTVKWDVPTSAVVSWDKPTSAATSWDTPTSAAISSDVPTSAAVSWDVPTTASVSLPVETTPVFPSPTVSDVPSTAASLPVETPTAPPTFNNANPKYFITFGDSYSQTGFNVTTGALPSPSNPFGNPAYPGWTTSGGANWIGNLVQNDNATTILNYNFAYGGATTDATLVTPYEPTVLSLIDQVSSFVSSIGSKPATAPWTSENSLFGIWIGVNDVGNTWWKGDANQIIDQIMVQIGKQAERIYEAGGRNFVFLNVPPIQRTPTQLTSCDSWCQGVQPAVIAYYNEALHHTITALASSHTDTHIAYVNTVEAFNTVLDNPAAYGAKDATCYAADGTSCLWWNDYHPGLAIQKVVAERAAEAVQDSVGGGWFTV